MSVNKVFLLGRVGKDPDVRHYETGSFANFSLATSERYKDKTGSAQERTEWHSIVVAGKMAKIVEDYVKKGTQLMIEGRIRTRKYEQNGQDKYITEIITERMELLGRPTGTPESRPEHTGNNEQSSMPDMSEYQEQTDDLPF